jgi:hypothetical protein
MAEAALRPVTLWLGLPLLARLEAFAEPLLLAAAEATAAAAEAAAAAEGQQRRSQRVAFETPQGGQQPPAAARKTAVAAAIDSILDSLQVHGTLCAVLGLNELRRKEPDCVQYCRCLLENCSKLSYAVASQEFGMERQPEASAAAHRRFGMSVSAAHVCAVLALPPPPLSDTPGSNALHGHRYLALDLFPVSGSWQCFKSSCSRNRPFPFVQRV